MLQFRNSEDDDLKKHRFKEVPPYVLSKFQNGVLGNISKHLKHYDENDNET